MVHREQRVASIMKQRLWNRDANPEPVLTTTIAADAQTGGNPDGGDGVGTSGYQAPMGGQVHLTPPYFTLIRLAAMKETKALRFI